jgi:SAM-dependent methyltransferase
MPFFDNFFQLAPTALGDWLQNEKARQMFERLLRHDRPGCLLEIGPGRGEFAERCLQAGIAYYALEANIEQARALCERNAHVSIGMSPPLPFGNADFDAVVAWNVIEHMPDFTVAIHFLSEMIRVARPGGLIGLNCPDLLGAGPLFWDTDYTHSFPTSMRRISQMFADQGLEMLDADFFSGIVSGAPASTLAWSAAHFPEGLVSSFTGKIVPRERIYRTRITFLRNVFVIGRKPAGQV